MMGRPRSSMPRPPLPGLWLQPEGQAWLQSRDAALPLRGLPPALSARRAYHRPGAAVKERALRMYAEGSSLSAIGRVLGYSAPAVLGRVKKGGGRGGGRP